MSVYVSESRLIFRSVSISHRGTQSGFLEQAHRTLITHRRIYEDNAPIHTRRLLITRSHSRSRHPTKQKLSSQTPNPGLRSRGERTSHWALCDVLTWASTWDTVFFEASSTTCGTRVLHLISHISRGLPVQRGPCEAAPVYFFAFSLIMRRLLFLLNGQPRIVAKQTSAVPRACPHVFCCERSLLERHLTPPDPV